MVAATGRQSLPIYAYIYKLYVHINLYTYVDICHIIYIYICILIVLFFFGGGVEKGTNFTHFVDLGMRKISMGLYSAEHHSWLSLGG